MIVFFKANISSQDESVWTSANGIPVEPSLGWVFSLHVHSYVPNIIVFPHISFSHILCEFVNYAVVYQVESSINSLLGVKCPDSIIKPSEDTTYLTRDYEDKFTGQYYEHGQRVRSEEAFCGHTSLRSGYSINLVDPNSRRPVRLNNYPWVSRCQCS